MRVRAHDLFISYSVDPSAPTFVALRDSFLTFGLDVFNPDIDMAVPGGANAELMRANVRASKLALAVMSRDGAIFFSQWCRAELYAAKEAGIPVLPVYNGDDTALGDVKAIIMGTVPGLERDSEHWPLVKYVFKEQIIELVSTQHATDVAARKREVAERVKALPTREREETAAVLSPERQMALVIRAPALQPPGGWDGAGAPHS